MAYYLTVEDTDSFAISTTPRSSCQQTTHVPMIAVTSLPVPGQLDVSCYCTSICFYEHFCIVVNILYSQPRQDR